MSAEKYQSSTGSVFESKMVDAKIFKSAIRSLKSTAPGARESCAFIIENSKSTLFTTHCIENWLVFDTKKINELRLLIVQYVRKWHFFSKRSLSQWTSYHCLQYSAHVDHAEAKPPEEAYYMFLKPLRLNTRWRTEKPKAQAKERNKKCILDLIDVMRMWDFESIAENPVIRIE